MKEILEASAGGDMGNTGDVRTPDSVRVRRARARAAVAASKRTGTLLPRSVYERAGARVPEGASNELQRQVRIPRRRRRWWQR